MKPKSPDVQVVRTHMIPVHPGKMTRVRIPASLTPAFAAPTSGRLEMLRVSGSESKGQMDVPASAEPS